jgi:hypothetical protein
MSWLTSLIYLFAARGGYVKKAGPIMAVPKPINLPSRRAENNGFDPNVQLVPGGSWAAPTGKAAQPSQTSSNGPPQKAEAAESPPTASASKAAWSVQQSAAPPRLAASSNASADFPKLGVTPPVVTAGVVPASRPSLVSLVSWLCSDSLIT